MSSSKQTTHHLPLWHEPHNLAAAAAAAAAAALAQSKTHTHMLGSTQTTHHFQFGMNHAVSVAATSGKGGVGSACGAGGAPEERAELDACGIANKALQVREVPFVASFCLLTCAKFLP